MPAGRSEDRQILTDHDANQYGTAPEAAQPNSYDSITGGGGTSAGTAIVNRLLQVFYLPAIFREDPLRRNVLAVMAFLGFMNVYAMRVNLSVAIIKMQEPRNITLSDGTIKMKASEFEYSNVEEGFILGSFFYGYFCTQLPGGWLAQRYGGRVVFGVGVLGTALLTMLTPPVAKMGQVTFMLLRFCEGLFEGVTYPAMHAIWSHWAPPLEKTKLATFAFSGSYFGTVVSMPLAAWLADRFGWPSIFYVFGVLSVLFSVLWFRMIAETPATDRRISQEEQLYIEQSIGFNYEQVKYDRPPWKEIMTSKPQWAITVAHVCSNWGFYTMLLDLPKYLKYQMGFTVSEVGFVTALPYFLMGASLLVSGQVADHLRVDKGLDTGLVRRLFGSGALFAQAVLCVLSAHSPNYVFAVLFITLGIGVGGFAWAGFSVNHLDIAPQFASLLMGVSNTFATLPGMISPIIVGSIVGSSDDPGGTPWEWRLVFYMCSMVYLVGACVYWMWASGEQQPWAQSTASQHAGHIDATSVGAHERPVAQP